MADILSPPMTTTFLYRPDSMKLAPVVKPYKNPEHAAAISKLNALTAPTSVATILAVAGKVISGVIVAKMIKSISFGSILVFASISLTAATPIIETPLFSPFSILLSLMPVRLVIHSSLVSTIVSSSLLVRI